MKKLRVIARIDVKNEFAIKGIHLEGLRKVGDPNSLAKKYYEEGIDEIIFMDAVAAYYDRNSLSEVILNASRDVFIPITVGGGIRTIDDIQAALENGADKVAINSKAINSPKFIEEAVKIYGSQCIVSSIDAKQLNHTEWYAYTDNGREKTSREVIDWAKEVEQLGAGEILLTSIDYDGTKKGFDYELCSKISDEVSIPVISSGGMGKSEDAVKLFKSSSIDGIAVASIIHYELESVTEIKQNLLKNSINVRS